MIALIITIVLLLILVVVSVYIAFHGGIFNHAKKASKDTANAIDYEANVLGLQMQDTVANGIAGIMNGVVNPTPTPDNPTPPTPPVEENVELKNFKTAIAQTITDLGVNTDVNQPVSKYITNIEQVGDQNYREGENSDLVIVATNLSSRYDQSINVTSVPNYELAVADDFIIVNRQMTYASGSDGHDLLHMSKNYDPTTGTLSLGRQKSFNSAWTFWNIYDVYMIKRNPQPSMQAYSEIEDVVPENIDLQEFKTELADYLSTQGYQDVAEKSAEEISQILQQFARNKFKAGVANYMTLVQGNLSSRYAQTVSATGIADYTSLTLDRFLVVNTGLAWVSGSDNENIIIMSSSYNSSTGTLSFGKQKSYANEKGSVWTFFNTYDIYFLKKAAIPIADL